MLPQRFVESTAESGQFGGLNETVGSCIDTRRRAQERRPCIDATHRRGTAPAAVARARAGTVVPGRSLMRRHPDSGFIPSRKQVLTAARLQAPSCIDARGLGAFRSLSVARRPGLASMQACAGRADPCEFSRGNRRMGAAGPPARRSGNAQRGAHQRCGRLTLWPLAALRAGPSEDSPRLSGWLARLANMDYSTC